MIHSIRIFPALGLARVLGGCSLMRPSDHDSNGNGNGMHRADATGSEPARTDPSDNCPPDKIGSGAGQGSDCRHGTGGATSTPPDSSNSNDPHTPTTPPR